MNSVTPARVLVCIYQEEHIYIWGHATQYQYEKLWIWQQHLNEGTSVLYSSQLYILRKVSSIANCSICLNSQLCWWLQVRITLFLHLNLQFLTSQCILTSTFLFSFCKCWLTLINVFPIKFQWPQRFSSNWHTSELVYVKSFTYYTQIYVVVLCYLGRLKCACFLVYTVCDGLFPLLPWIPINAQFVLLLFFYIS